MWNLSDDVVREIFEREPGVLVIGRDRSKGKCKLYELYESETKGRFYFYELWESQAALDQHAGSPHFKHLEQTVGELVQEPFEVNILERVLTGAPAA